MDQVTLKGHRHEPERQAIRTRPVHRHRGVVRWSPLFRQMVLTDGAKFVADNGGAHGAYWLMDAIASHQPKALRNEMLRDIQFWSCK